MEEKKSELLIKISVDTTELDAAIEKIKLLNSLYQEKNIMKILSTVQQTKERLKEIEVDQFANECGEAFNTVGFGIHFLDAFKHSVLKDCTVCFV